MASSAEKVRFDEVALNCRNGIYKSKEFHGSGTQIVNMGELFAHPRLSTNIPLKRIQLSKAELVRTQLEEGDLLFARRSLTAAGAGKCTIVREVTEPTTFESSIIRIRLNKSRVDPFYLYYLFSSEVGYHLLDTIKRQDAVSGITGTDLMKLQIPLLPLTEQQRIADILGTLDDKIELNRQLNATLEQLARALFQSWFVDFDPVRAKASGESEKSICRRLSLTPELLALFPAEMNESALGEIPMGWSWETIGSLAAINDWTLSNTTAAVREGSRFASCSGISGPFSDAFFSR